MSHTEFQDLLFPAFHRDKGNIFFSSQKQGQRDWTQPQTVAMLLKWLLGSSSGSVPVGPKACT